jgi:hypothetical protein
MDDREIFDQKMMLQGGRLKRIFEPGSQPEIAYRTMAGWANGLIQNARELVPNLPHIHFDFVHNPIPNAFAFKAKGRYFIGLTTGMPYLLDLILFRILSHQKLVTFIGDPLGEAPELPRLTGYDAHAQKMADIGHWPQVPKTPARLVYAIQLRQTAIMFLLGHELAHIALGHVDYWENKSGNAIIDETHWTAGISEDSLERQAIEINADGRCVLSGIASLKLTHESLRDVIPPWATGPQQPGDLLFLWAFAVNSLVRLLGDGRFTSEEIVSGDHPPHAVRRSMIMQLAHHATVKSWDPQLGETSVETLRSALHSTEGAFEVILGGNPTFGGLHDAFSPPAQQHLNKLNDYWFKEFGPKVKPFAFEEGYFG